MLHYNLPVPAIFQQKHRLQLILKVNISLFPEPVPFIAGTKVPYCSPVFADGLYHLFRFALRYTGIIGSLDYQQGFRNFIGMICR